MQKICTSCLTVDGNGNTQTVVSFYRNGEHMTETARNTTGPYRNDKYVSGGETWTGPVESQNGLTTIGTEYVPGDGKWGLERMSMKEIRLKMYWTRHWTS